MPPLDVSPAGGDYLDQMLRMDEGASILGEFAIGTNYAVT